MNEIIFDKNKRTQLKRAYTVAVNENKEVFIFEGNELLTKYAKYLLEYLETVIK